MMNKQLKRLIPPILFEPLHRLFRRTGCRELPGWPDDSRAGYSDEAIAKLVSAKTENHLIRHPEIFSLSELQSVSAAAAAAVEYPELPLRIIDIGGGSGMHFFQVHRVLPDLELDWRIVEQPAFMKLSERHPMLSFYPSFDEAQAGIRPALIHSSCALGFIRESDALLDKILNSAAAYILLSRMSVTSGCRDIYADHIHYLSSNGPGNFLPPGFRDKLISYPVRIFSESALEKRLTSSYDIIWKSDDPSAVLEVPGREIFGRSWFLRRRG